MDTKLKEISEHILSLSSEVSDRLVRGFWLLEKTESTSGRQDMATSLDHEIGVYLTEELTKKFGDDIRIDSEEAEERTGTGRYVVRIDPLDGTKNAISGIDMIATVVALSVDGVTQFGLIINPFSKKVYHAIKSHGAYLNNKRIHVNNESIKDNFVIHEQPTSKLFKNDTALYSKHEQIQNKLMKVAYRLRNIGLGSLSIGWVSEGAATAHVDFSGTTKLYDIEAAVLIAREAGAVIGTIDGKLIDTVTFSLDSDKKYINENLLIANPKAFAEITKIALED